MRIGDSGKVKSLVTRRVGWRDDGPLRAAYAKRLSMEFLAKPFSGAQELFSFKTRSLSFASQVLLKRKIQRLIAEFDDASSIDATLAERDIKPVAMIIGFRQFGFSIVDEFERRV